MVKYSIIVAVYNRLDEVKELLGSVEKLAFDRDDFELIFVDDGSQDGFKDFIRSYESSTGVKIDTVYQRNMGPGAARNHGMQIARGNYFIFLDSDCMVPFDWLRQIDLEVHKRDLDAFGGPDTHHESFSPLLKAINYSMTSFIGTGGTRGSRKSIGKFYPRSFNMGIRREVFEYIGGMNQLRHGQDMDFSARIYEAGYKVGLIPTAMVYHKRRTSLWKFFKQIFNWGVARINLGKLHPSLLKPIHFLPSVLIIVTLIVAIISVVFSARSVLFVILAFWGLICLIAFSQSLFRYKNLSAALLSILTLNLQVLAYGTGLLWAVLQLTLGREPRGFVKNYYGVKGKIQIGEKL